MVRQIVIDTETTGYDPYKGNHRIIEIALIEVVDNKITGKSLQSYFNPQGKRSNKGAYETHNIKDSFLLDKPLFGDRLNEIVKFINNDEIVFYNEDFDLKFLDHEALLADSDVVFSKDYKSICLQKYVAKKLGRVVSLDNACVVHHVDNSKRVVHGALIDTKLTAELLIAINTNPNNSLTSVPNENKFSDTEKFAFPRAYKDVQLNFCKNTQCLNYGAPPKHAKIKKNGKFTRISGDYTLRVKRRKGRDDETNLICKLCGSSNKLISNKGFVQEVERLKKIQNFMIHHV